MNFITHDAAYSLFPNATFLRRTYLTFSIVMSDSTSPNPIRDKYAARGFKLSTSQPQSTPQAITENGASLDRDTRIQFGHRLIGDKSMWTIPLETTGLATTSTLSTPGWFRSNGFSLEIRTLRILLWENHSSYSK
jgi:hypothetical protein